MLTNPSTNGKLHYRSDDPLPISQSDTQQALEICREHPRILPSDSEEKISKLLANLVNRIWTETGVCAEYTLAAFIRSEYLTQRCKTSFSSLSLESFVAGVTSQLRLEGRLPKGKESEFPSATAASKLQAIEILWLWYGLIAQRGITLLSSLPKVGKTTLMSHLIRNMGKGTPLCGLEVKPTTVLYISEESDTRWAKRRDALGIGDNVHFICRPFRGKPDHEKWGAFLEHVKQQVKQIGAGLVVFDTLSALWPVVKENDAGDVQAALMPLWNIAEQTGILPVHHLKKGDGQEGTGARGSGALTAFVDTIVELRRHDPNDRNSRKRILIGYGRDEETPAELVIEMTPFSGEYVGLGDRATTKNNEIKAILNVILPTHQPGLSMQEILDNWTEDEVPTKKAILDVLNEGVRDGKWVKEGGGKKGDPHRFHTGQAYAV